MSNINFRFDPEQFPDIAEEFERQFNEFIAPIENQLFRSGKVFNVGLIDARAFVYGAYSDDKHTLSNLAEFGRPDKSESPYNPRNMNYMFQQLIEKSKDVRSLINQSRQLERWFDEAFNSDQASNRDDYWNMVKYKNFK